MKVKLGGMKIAWFQDMNPFEAEGGAQLNDRGMIKLGIKRGHDIEIFTPQNIGSKSLEGTDLVIFSNITAFNKELIKEVSQMYPYIFHHKDFNFYKYRLYFPQYEDHRKYYGIDFNFWNELLKNAKLNIWLAPLHRSSYYKIFPELKKYKSACIPSCIDITKFKPVEGIERIPNTVALINSLLPFKGRYLVYEYAIANPQLQFIFIGSDQTPINIPNAKYIPYIKNTELPKILSQCEFFMHLPPGVEPFGRTCVEAMLSGCKIITNENNGAFSYKWMREGTLEERKQKLKEASLGFWEAVESEMVYLEFGNVSIAVKEGEQ